MENIQEFNASGLTDYHLFYDTPYEKENLDFEDTYFVVSGILKHDSINSVSRLKYRFIRESEAKVYWENLRTLFPTSILSITKITETEIKQTCGIK